MQKPWMIPAFGVVKAENSADYIDSLKEGKGSDNYVQGRSEESNSLGFSLMHDRMYAGFQSVGGAGPDFGRTGQSYL